jgi:tetratricopeptide (TPR) repeat protein
VVKVLSNRIGSILLILALEIIVCSAIGDSVTQLNITDNEILSISNYNSSRLFIDRNNFETNLIKHVPAPQDYEIEIPPSGVKEIIYKSRELPLKAWLLDKPNADKKYPAVVFAHGGFAFGRSDWDDAQEIINQDYILMMPMLRGENGNPGDFEFFYGEVDDIIAAADYLANVSYVDKDRIFLCGHSVGGTLSMLVSMMPSKYRACASFGGSPDQKSFFRYSGMPVPFNSTNGKETELRSPIVYSDSIMKPLFIYVGDHDGYLYFSKEFAKKARENGKPCEVNVITGDHFSSLKESITQSLNEFNNIQSYEAYALNRSLAYQWALKGRALTNLSQYEESINCYNKAIEIDSKNAEALSGKGKALLELGLYNESVNLLDRAIKIDPYNADSWKNQGIAYGKLSRYEDAIDCFDKAVYMNPGDEELPYYEGNAFLNLKKYTKALFAYEKAIKLNQQHAESWCGKGLALYNLGMYDEAIRSNDKAIAINPSYAMAWYNKGLALKKVNRIEEAEIAFAEARELGYEGE